MNLKPIKQLTDEERRAEVEQRLRIEVKESHDVVTIMLLHLRAANIGDDRIAPPEPEPEWRRWRETNTERPEHLSRVEFDFDGEMYLGYYVADEVDRFCGINGATVYYVGRWRYIEEPRRWVCIAEEGTPEDAGEYWVREPDGTQYIDRFEEHAVTGEWVWWYNTEATHWQRIAPPTPFEEDKK